MKIDTLEILLQDQLKDIYDAEKRLIRALPKMAKATSSQELRGAIEDHLEVTRNHVTRLEEVFEEIGVPAKGQTCAGMKGLIEEGEEVIGQDGEALKDLAIIAAAQRVEHYEIAAYGTAREIAEQLGVGRAATLLEETLNEEKEADARLTQIAEQLYTEVAGSGRTGGRQKTMGANSRGRRTRTSGA